MSQKQGFGIFFILIILASAFFLYTNATHENTSKVSISEALLQYQKGEVTKVNVDGNILQMTLKEGKILEVVKEDQATLMDLGIDPTKVQVDVKDGSNDGFWGNMLISFLPLVFIVFLLVFMFRQAQGSANSAFSFGKSKASLYDHGNKKKITFKDVAGVEEAKEDLFEVVDFLKNPKKYTQMGAKIPKGVILYGPPGTGKTLLARAVAGEAGVPFYFISGSEFVEMFVGVGASRVRDLFQKARKTAPCIIFMDEIDAVGRQRGTGVGGGNDEREQTLNQILVEMDGFDNETNVIVMASTNRPDVLDPALLRPGRFDRRITIDLPDIKARQEILKVHAQGKPITDEINYLTVAQKTIGFSGADLESVMNEASILTVKKREKIISQKNVDEAIERVLMGPERKSKTQNELERKNTAYHEAGHAIVGASLKYCHPVHKITTVPRGMSLGSTWFLPQEDMRSMTKIKFEHELASLLGGRVAEELTFGNDMITTGAQNDLERATKMARSMVTQYGMSEVLGTRVYGDQHGSLFLGKNVMESRDYSEETASKIDKEVLNIIQNAYTTATNILKKHSKELQKVSEALLQQETLLQEEFEALLGRKQACDLP